MDTILAYLKNLYSQIKDLFAGMTPGSRIIAVLLVAILLTSFCFLIIDPTSRQSPGTHVFLYNGRVFTQLDQRAIADALAKSGLANYTWIEGKLQVVKTEQHLYTLAIVKEKAIKDAGNATNEMLGTLSPWDPAKTMDTRVRVAAQTDAAKMIELLDEIETATVHANERITMDDKFWTKKKIISVAVTVIPVSNRALSEGVISSISGTVRAAFGITDLKEISITDGRNGRAYQGSDEYVVGAGKHYLGEKEKHEREWQRKLDALLNYIPGVIVNVDVDLTKNSEERSLEIKHEKSLAVINENLKTMEAKREGADRALRPGYIAQQNTPLPNTMSSSMSGGKAQESLDESQRTLAPQGVEKNTIAATFTPTSIRATVQIPRGYIRTVAQNRIEKAPVIEGQEPQELNDTYLATVEAELLANVQKVVANQIGIYKTSSPIDLEEQVTTLVYDDMQSAAITPLTFLQVFGAWLVAEWETLTLLGLVCAGLFILWSVTRPAKPEPIVIYESPDLPMPTPEELAALEDDEEDASKKKKKWERSLNSFDKNARTLQEEVVDLVLENPEAAAAVVRQWIGNIVPAAESS